jgi:flagellar protein FlaI
VEQNISIFESNNPGQDKDIFVHGLSNEINKIIKINKGLFATAKILSWKPSKLKETAYGRAPISIRDLKRLLELAGKDGAKMMKSIEQKEATISCRKSSTKIMPPKEITPDLAYIIGIILGDGHLSNNKCNIEGNWSTSVFFDNQAHSVIYQKMFKKAFGVLPKNRLQKPNCFESRVNSKTIHWILRSFFEMTNGKKANKIHAPKIIQNSGTAIKSAFLQGLFDSDGTITKKGDIKFATTSQQMAYEMQKMLYGFGLESSVNKWIKHEKYLPLYVVRIKGKSYQKYFAKLIGFKHPLKKLLLSKFS